METLRLPFRWLIPLVIATSLALPGAAGAAPRCEDVWTDRAVLGGRIDGAYTGLVKRWADSWKRNVLNRLIGTHRGLEPSREFDMRGFLESREYRSWFELQNRTLDQLAARHESAVARTKLLPDPQQALAAKLLAIREARHTIDVAYYILRGDKTGLSFIHELKLAVERGVNVRFLVDSTGTIGMTPHSPLRSLIDHADRHGGFIRDVDGNVTRERARVEVVVFNSLADLPGQATGGALRGLLRAVSQWLPFRVDQLAYSWNRRSHDKILLIDGAFNERAIAFIGGRNVADPYYGVPKVDDHTYIDFEVMMRGVRPDPRQRSSLSVGGQVSEYFDHIYFHLGNRELTRSVLGLMRGYERQHRRMEEAHREVEEILGLDKNADGLREELLRLGFEEHHVDIVHTVHNLYRREASRETEIRDHKLEIRNGQALIGRLEELVPREDKEIVIVSPYLWMSQRQIRLLKAWLLKDPARKLTILTNSIMTSDNMPAQILVDNVIGPALMLDAGLRNSHGEQFRRSIADQVQIFQYGRGDAKELGGSAGYGKLHAKGMLLKGSGISVIGTFNNDPRSLLLNSEGAAVIKGGATAEHFSRDIEAIKAQSHLWGSEEYHAIRANEGLGFKTSVARQSRILYQILVKLNLWWLI